MSITARGCCIPFEGGRLTNLNFKGIITVLSNSEVHYMIHFFLKLKKNSISFYNNVLFWLILCAEHGPINIYF